jgi:hypothetical protein
MGSASDRLETVLVERAPRTNVRRLTAQLDARGQITQVTIDQQQPRVPPAGAIPTPGGFYAPYAFAFMNAAQARDSLVALQLLSGDAPQSFQFRRVGTDHFDLVNSAGATTMRARLNRHGQLLWIDAHRAQPSNVCPGSTSMPSHEILPRAISVVREWVCFRPLTPCARKPPAPTSP